MTKSDELTLLIEREDGCDWNVWISLPDHDPRRDAFGFIIGVGETRNAAITQAVEALENTVERLQTHSIKSILAGTAYEV